MFFILLAVSAYQPSVLFHWAFGQGGWAYTLPALSPTLAIRPLSEELGEGTPQEHLQFIHQPYRYVGYRAHEF